MTPQTLIIDRSFKGVGRIKRATGTTIPKVRQAISRMLTTLHQAGRLDVLRAVRDGKLELLQVYDAFRRNAVDTLPMANTLEPLAGAMKKYIDGSDLGLSGIRDARYALRALLGVNAAAKVADLPVVLESLRDSLGKRHPRAFNLIRAHASRFVSATLKRNHPLWAAINAVEPRQVKAKRKRTPLTIGQMRAWFPSPETDHTDAIAWGLVTTGMRPVEYWNSWRVESDRIVVLSAKQRQTGVVERAIPLLVPPAVPRIHRRTWENRVRERTRQITPYDLRRTYANWLESAGIPRTRRKLYLGHGTKDVTDLYELHEVHGFLVEDASKLRAQLNLSPTKAHTMALHKEKGA